MGASPINQKQNKIPTQGSRVIQILNPELEGKLQPFTDYIIQPSPQQLKNSSNQVHAVVFSILDYSLRNEVLPVSQNKNGLKINYTKVTDSCLKITKVFPHSPCEHLAITANQYIVGLLEAEFSDLNTFTKALNNLITNGQQGFNLAICNKVGVTRSVYVSVAMLQEWRRLSQEKQGILGCQLAQGWVHRFNSKPTRQSYVKIQSLNVKHPKQQKIDQIMESIGIQNSRIIQHQHPEVGQKQQQLRYQSSNHQQIRLRLSLKENIQELMKNEQRLKGRKVCHCQIESQSCERCYTEDQENFFFFNKKTNRLIVIPSSLMLKQTH